MKPSGSSYRSTYDVHETLGEAMSKERGEEEKLGEARERSPHVERDKHRLALRDVRYSAGLEAECDDVGRGLAPRDKLLLHGTRAFLDQGDQGPTDGRCHDLQFRALQTTRADANGAPKTIDRIKNYGPLRDETEMKKFFV